MNLATTIPRAWLAFTENKKYLILIAIIEIIFFISFVYLHFKLFMPSAEEAIKIGEAMQQDLQKLPESEYYQLEGLVTKNQDFNTAYRSLFAMIVYFFLGSLALFILLRAPLWYLSHKSILKKMPFKKVLIKFPLLSIFWLVAALATISVFSLFIDYDAILSFGIPVIATFLLYLALLAVLYFSQVSFALIPSQQTFKNTFIYGTKHAKSIAPAFIVNFIICFVFIGLPFQWTRFASAHSIQPYSALFLIIFIASIICAACALAFARLHMIIATWINYKPHKIPALRDDF